MVFMSVFVLKVVIVEARGMKFYWGVTTAFVDNDKSSERSQIT